MRTVTLLCLVLCLATAAVAQMPAPPTPILLWPNGAPGAMGNADTDKPNVTIYLPKGRAAHTGVVVLPGGAYKMLAMDHEGRQIAQWLNNLGIAAFVVQYRYAPYHHPIELGDAKHAMRYVRSHATEFGIAPERIGLWGFSAGGHLASTVGTHFDAGDSAATDPIDRVSCRPDFMILSYPVIGPLGQAAKYSFEQLLGPNPDPALVRELTNDLKVTPQTPPTFLVHATDDDAVSVENSVNFYSALVKAGVPAEMHIYERGGHGFGLASLDPTLSSWSARLADWLRGRGVL